MAKRELAPELDRKDFGLLESLLQNASLRLEDLAKRVGLAPSSVHDRLRRLHSEGVIRKWTIDVDPASLGLSVLAFVGVRATKPCSELMPTLRDIACIEECYSVAGDLSMILKVRVPSTDHLLELSDQLRKIKGIEQTETTIVLRTHLERRLPLALVQEGK